MGGIGSGNHWRWGTANTVESFRAIDVRRWARDGLLEPGRHFSWQWSIDGEKTADIQVEAKAGAVRLKYKQRSYGDDWQHESYDVLLTSTGCNYGGERVWFFCPARGCGRRVAKLHGGTIFACRKCHQLTYQSQREDFGTRAASQADKIRERLKWPPGILNGGGCARPKNMHWRTYWRLVGKHDDYVKQSLAGQIDFLSRMNRHLNKAPKGD